MPFDHSESGATAPQGKVPKKPAGKIRTEHCYCSHPAADHDSESGCSQCGCQQHQARPCVCGHGAAQHNPACESCDCRQFREDGSPEFLLRRGIRAGRWQFITSEQLRFLMRPDQDFQVRVWACGMLHSVGQQRRLAVKWVNGKPATVPLSPGDIVAELNALDMIGCATKQNVRRAIADLEAQGAARRVGRHRNNVRPELLHERNRREWESWLADPDTSEDDKAFARRILQENAPDWRQTRRRGWERG
ncbi:MAG TPA: hypothetical protein VFQ79_06980 [Bryobacteraceae bacterium]|nr:hypothetical protein [Bryobacteraceae bacterium]